jgi:hypothetical protein
MVARVTHVRVNPEDVDESVRLFDESVVPAAEQEEGFMGAMLLVREDGRALAIDLCDTLEHLRANERNGFYQSQVTKFASKIVDRLARRGLSTGSAPPHRAASTRSRAPPHGSGRGARTEPGRREPAPVQPEHSLGELDRDEVAPSGERRVGLGEDLVDAPGGLEAEVVEHAGAQPDVPALVAQDELDAAPQAREVGSALEQAEQRPLTRREHDPLEQQVVERYRLGEPLDRLLASQAAGDRRQAHLEELDQGGLDQPFHRRHPLGPVASGDPDHLGRHPVEEARVAFLVDPLRLEAGGGVGVRGRARERRDVRGHGRLGEAEAGHEPTRALSQPRLERRPGAGVDGEVDGRLVPLRRGGRPQEVAVPGDEHRARRAGRDDSR